MRSQSKFITVIKKYCKKNEKNLRKISSRYVHQKSVYIILMKPNTKRKILELKKVHGYNCYKNMTDKFKNMMIAIQSILGCLETWIREGEKKHNTTSVTSGKKGRLSSLVLFSKCF